MNTNKTSSPLRGILKGVAATALCLALAFAAAAPALAAAGGDTKEEQIARHEALSAVLVASIEELGECPTKEAVLEILEETSAREELPALAAALELVADAKEWCPSVQAALTAAIEAAQIVLAVRETEATGSSLTTQAGPLSLGGYGPDWGSGGSGYTY